MLLSSWHLCRSVNAWLRCVVLLLFQSILCGLSLGLAVPWNHHSTEFVCGKLQKDLVSFAPQLGKLAIQ